jgi:hypothetical protein
VDASQTSPAAEPLDLQLSYEGTSAGDPRELLTFQCVTPDWTASGTIGKSWRGLVVSRMEIVPDPEVDNEPGSVSSSVLRQVPIGAILAGAQAHFVGTHGPGIKHFTKPAERPSPGRTPLSDALLREVAEGYLAEVAPGKPRGAIKRLAERMDKPQPTVSRWVGRARQDGWLGPAIPGREGADVGPRLFEARAAELEARLHKAADELQPPSDS